MSNTLKLGNGKWATGKDTLLSFSDTNNNYKPLPFSFSRASSGTVVNKSGLIETVGSGEPRIDFKDNTKGALLLEPQRSNKLTTSKDFSSFIKSGTVTTTTDYGISPSGQTDSTRVVFSSSNNAFYKLSIHSGNTETNSMYVKGTVGETIKFGKGATVNGGGIFTLNGKWQRLDFVSTTGNQFTINTYSSVTARDIEIWGAQVEEGSYATSYIPTSGSAVTRVAESSSQTVPSGVIGQTEGVIYWEGIINGFDGNFSNIVTGEKNTTTSFAVLHKGSSSQFQCSVFDGSEKGKCIGGSVSVGETCKIAYAYKSGNFALYVNGVSVAISTDTWTPPSTIDDIYIGDTTSYFGNKESNTHKEVKLYNTRLSNAELQALTTI